MARSGGAHASLPYKIMQGGAFRPPVLRQEDLQPLSRLRRLNTHIDPSPSFADFTKKILNPVCASEFGSGDKLAGIKNALLQLNKSGIRPTKTCNLSDVPDGDRTLRGPVRD